VNNLRALYTQTMSRYIPRAITIKDTCFRSSERTMIKVYLFIKGYSRKTDVL